jgi:hypothetical protein
MMHELLQLYYFQVCHCRSINRYADLDYVVCSLENYEYLYLDESIYVPSQFKTTYERRLLTECEALCTNKYADV